uniref:Uncharacterized protein n=1 Tax=Arundo donax TaxID=35708 RepID=A0A0A9A9M6_ARUDO
MTDPQLGAVPKHEGTSSTIQASEQLKSQLSIESIRVFNLTKPPKQISSSNLLSHH